jgi:hypothetical protein
MSMIFCDGFDDNAYQTKWTTYSLGGISYQTGRNGNAIRSAGNNLLGKVVDSSQEHATFIAGCAVKTPALGDQVELLYLTSDSGATQHISVYQDFSARLWIRRGGTNLVGGTFQLSANNWYYVEIKVFLSATVGTAELRVDGRTLHTYSGNTKNGGTKTVFDSVKIGGNGGQSYYYDDLYVNNGAGSTNNDFLGDVSIETLTPNADGTYSQFLGSDGNSVNNYALVNEATPDQTSYVASGNVGDKDSYNFTNLTRTSGTIFNVQASAYANKSDSAARTMKLLSRSGASETLSDVKTLNTGFAMYTYQYENDPATGAPWTIGGVNGAEFGTTVDS